MTLLIAREVEVLAEECLAIEQSELADQVAKLFIEASKLPKNNNTHKALMEWEVKAPLLTAKYMALAAEADVSVFTMFDVVDSYLRELDNS